MQVGDVTAGPREAMYTVTVSIAQAPANMPTPLRLFWEALIEARKQKSRVYRTYIDSPEGRFVLMTTSKELHLKLGSVDWVVNYRLAKLLESEFDQHRVSGLLLSFADPKQGREEEILVTMAKDDKEMKGTVFTLSPAR